MNEGVQIQTSPTTVKVGGKTARLALGVTVLTVLAVLVTLNRAKTL
jgi:hypothetical protein